MNFTRIKFVFQLLAVLLCLSAFGCQSDETAFENDALAKQTVNQATLKISKGQKVTPADFAEIKSVYEKYPQSKSVREIYRTALIAREDWNALQEFLEKLPDAEKTEADKLNLGKTYFKLGKYDKSAEVLKEFENSENTEAKSILANAYFKAGKNAEAKTLLDKDWEKIVSEKRVDEMTVRGMIYFYEKDNSKAIEILQKVLEIRPDSIPAANGLSRIYASQGDSAKAEEYLTKVQDAYDKMTADERRKTNYVEKIYKLQEAYKAKRFQEVINIANEILPEADAKNKAALYQFLYNSHKALGQQEEAQEVLVKAREMQQK